MDGSDEGSCDGSLEVVGFKDGLGIPEGVWVGLNVGAVVFSKKVNTSSVSPLVAFTGAIQTT